MYRLFGVSNPEWASHLKEAQTTHPEGIQSVNYCGSFDSNWASPTADVTETHLEKGILPGVFVRLKPVYRIVMHGGTESNVERTPWAQYNTLLERLSPGTVLNSTEPVWTNYAHPGLIKRNSLSQPVVAQCYVFVNHVDEYPCFAIIEICSSLAKAGTVLNSSRPVSNYCPFVYHVDCIRGHQNPTKEPNQTNANDCGRYG